MNYIATRTILWCFLLWIPFLILLPFIFATLSLLAIYKVIIIILCKLLKQQDLISPVTGLDVMFSTDDYFNRPIGSLGFIWLIDGPISYELITKRLEAALLTPSTSNSGAYTLDGYEKLTSVYPTFWMGYPFWKRTHRKLDIREHVIQMNPTMSKTTPPSKFIVHLADINKLICRWMSEPFSEGRPLWEVRIVPQITFSENDSPNLLHHEPGLQTGLQKTKTPMKVSLKGHQIRDNTFSFTMFTTISDEDNGIFEDVIRSNKEKQGEKIKSILILKTHHMLGDGNSMLRLLDKIIDSPLGPPTEFESSYEGQNIFKNMETQKSLQTVHQYQQDGKVIKQKEGKMKVTDQQEECIYSHSNCGKSSHFTTTYLPQDNDATAKVIKAPRDFLLTKSFVVEQESKFYLRWRWAKVSLQLLWRQLSNTIYFTFFIPSSIFSLVNEFILHKDYWFTHRKNSSRVNMASVNISMEKLNKIRKKLCKKPSLPVNALNSHEWSLNNVNDCSTHLRTSFCHKVEGNDNQRAKTPVSVPIIVMTVTALAGALRRLILGKEEKFERYKGSSSKSLKLKSVEQTSVNFVIAISPQKEHPGKLKFCNFWTHGILKVKILAKDALSRLHQVNNFYWEIRNQQYPEIYHSMIKIYSLLPQPLLSLMSNYNMGASIGVTNLAASSRPVFIGGRQVYRQYGYFGLQWRHASLTLTLLSYNGKMEATILANESVIPDQENVEKLLHQYFLDELKLLDDAAADVSSQVPCEPSRGKRISQRKFGKSKEGERKES